MHCCTLGKLTPGDGSAAPTRYKMTMLSVKRIFRLRSAVRSDEMKAESTLPPAQPNSGRGMPTGIGRLVPLSDHSWVHPRHAPNTSRPGRTASRVKPCTRLTAGTDWPCQGGLLAKVYAASAG